MASSFRSRISAIAYTCYKAIEILLELTLITVIIRMLMQDESRWLYVAIFALPYACKNFSAKLLELFQQEYVYPERTHADGYLYKAMMSWCGRANIGVPISAPHIHYLGSRNVCYLFTARLGNSWKA